MDSYKEEMSLDEYKRLLTRNNKPHKTGNCIGVYDIFKDMRKDKWQNIKFNGNRKSVTEKDFYAIIRGINNRIADTLIQGKEIELPHNMGKLETRRTDTTPYYNSKGKLVVPKGIDWKSTVELWYSDEEARNNKTLIRYNNRIVYRYYYNKSKVDFNNSSCYTFMFNRNLKRNLQKYIENNKIDAFVLY